MKAIILAAGQGTRLRPYTNDRPKTLVEVNGRSLLDHQLAVLRAECVKRIAVVGGYKSGQLVRDDVTLYVNDRFAETNMVWSLLCAQEELSGDVIVAYGDIVYSRSVLRRLLESDVEIGVVVDNAWEPYWRERFEDPLAAAESLRINDRGRIEEIGQPDPEPQDIQSQYIGLIRFTGAGLAALKRVLSAAQESGCLLESPVETAYMTELLQSLIVAGEDVWPVPIQGEWVEIDTVRDLTLEVTCERVARIAAEVLQPSFPDPGALL